MGEAHLGAAAPEQPRLRRCCRSETAHDGSDALRGGLEHGVRQTLLHIGQPPPQTLDDAGRDTPIREQHAADVLLTHQAQHRGLDRLGDPVAHALADEVHLTEQRAGAQNRQSEPPTLGRDPVDPYLPGFHDEQGLAPTRRRYRPAGGPQEGRGT